MIRAVLLDAGGTLFHRVPSTADVILDVLAKHGRAPPRADVHDAFHRAIHNEGVPEEGREAHAWPELNAAILRDLGCEPTDAAVADLAHALEHQRRALYPDVIPGLDALRDAGLRLAVVSNFTHSLPRILDELAIASRFETVVYSWRARVAKPDPRIYRMALDALGVAPAEAVMVGDSWEHDVAGAEAVGVRGYFLARDAGERPGRERTVRSLVELASHVAKPSR